MLALVNSLAAAGFAQNDVAKMLSELRKFGANGHLYIPGVGAISGINAGNYLDSAGTTSASVDGNVGLVLDGAGGVGPDLTQSTTGYQPKLRRGIVNNYTYSHDASNAAYSKTNIAVSAVGGVQKITPNVGAAQHYVSKTYTAVSGNAYTKAVAAKADGFNWVWLYGSNPVAHAYFNVATGQIGTVTGGTATIAQGPDGYYVCALSCTATGAAWALETHSVGSNGGGSTTTGDGTKGTLLKACAVFDGTLTAQQILAQGGIPVTTSAPTSSSSGAYKLDFDGTDDYMSLGSVPFQMADDHYSAVALTPNAVNTGKHILNPANGAASQQVGGISINGSSKFSAMWCDNATNLLGVTDTVTVTLGVASVLASRRVGTTGVLRKNGAQLGEVSLASLGATTLTLPGVIGSYKGGANPSAISLYGVAVIKGTVTDAQALIFERGLNALSQYAAGRF